MPRYKILLTLCISLPQLTLSLPAQEEASALAAREESVVPQWQKNFESLDPEKQKAYRTSLLEARRLFGQKRIIESINQIAEARKIFPDDPDALNLLGACQVEFRSFDKARSAFEAALEKQGAYLQDIAELRGDARKRRMRPVLNILFNIAEMDFVTRQWEECQNRIEKIIPEMDPANLPMIRLLEFKYFLCKLKLGEVDQARTLSDKYDYLDDQPYYYYANAAMAYHDKKEKEAERWRASARRVFRRTSTLAPWEDTMIEVGFVKSFYGGAAGSRE